VKPDDWLVLVVVVVFAAMGLAVVGYELFTPDCLSCDAAGSSVSNAPGP
jgi:hypothetical protein